MIYNEVSECCRRSVTRVTRHINPDNTKIRPFKAILCSCCGKEVDEPVQVTECCGEERCTCELEEKRAELVSEGIRLGVNDPTVIALSQQVDELHNEINRGAR